MEKDSKKLLKICIKKKKLFTNYDYKPIKRSKFILICIGTPINRSLRPKVKEFLSLNKNFSLNKFSNKHKNVFIDKEGFYFVLPKKLKNNILIDGFFSAKIVKND